MASVPVCIVELHEDGSCYRSKDFITRWPIRHSFTGSNSLRYSSGVGSNASASIDRSRSSANTSPMGPGAIGGLGFHSGASPGAARLPFGQFGIAHASTDKEGPGTSKDETVVDKAEAQLEVLEAKLRAGKRRKRASNPFPSTTMSDLPTREVKPWESMSLAEKAWEIYVGEKGMLFWLNKLAYASIFVIAGGWIVFRFVGPALGWYQLESPLLPPEKLFTGDVVAK